MWKPFAVTFKFASKTGRVSSDKLLTNCEKGWKMSGLYNICDVKQHQWWHQLWCQTTSVVTSIVMSNNISGDISCDVIISDDITNKCVIFFFTMLDFIYFIYLKFIYLLYSSIFSSWTTALTESISALFSQLLRALLCHSNKNMNKLLHKLLLHWFMCLNNIINCKKKKLNYTLVWILVSK